MRKRIGQRRHATQPGRAHDRGRVVATDAARAIRVRWHGGAIAHLQRARRVGHGTGQHQRQRGEGHQLPRHEQGRDARRDRHRQHRGDEQRQHDAAVLLVRRVGVSHAVQAGHDRHRTDDQQEHSRQRVHRDRSRSEGKHTRHLRGPPVPTQRRDPRGDTGGAGQSRQPTHGRRPDPRGSQTAREGTGQRRAAGDPQAEGDQVHRPVSPLSAATMADGSGGHPGTVTSTGTTSPTVPSTP